MCARSNSAGLAGLILALGLGSPQSSWAAPDTPPPAKTTPAPVAPALRKLFVSLPDDVYQFVIPIDLDHDVSDCDPAVELKSGQLPDNYEFIYFPCTGRAFNARMAGSNGIAATAKAAGKIFQVYKGVRFDGHDLGRVIVIYTPKPGG